MKKQQILLLSSLFMTKQRRTTILVLMDFLLLGLTGLAVGFLSSFFGIGGGSLIVPILYSLYPTLTDEQVIATSLTTIFLLSSNNTFQYFKRKELPPRRIIVNFLISATIGAVSGAKLTYLIETNTSKKIVASVLLLIVAKLFLTQKIKGNPPLEKTKDYKIFITGFVGAFVSSISGLGGGVIFIPLLISFAKINMNSVSPYSNLAMVVATLMGAIPHLLVPIYHPLGFPETLDPYFVGKVNFAIVFILILGGLISSRLGVRYNGRVASHIKRYALASLLLILSIKLFSV